MKKFLTFLIFSMIITGIFAVDLIEIKNEYLSVKMDKETGCFNIYAIIDGKEIPFFDDNFPNSTSLMLQILDKQFQVGSSGIASGFIKEPYTNEGALKYTWNKNKEQVSIKLSFIEDFITGKADKVKIDIKLLNKDETERFLGMRLLFNTQIENEELGKYVFEPVGRLTQPTSYSNQMMPNSWYAVPSFDDPRFIISGFINNSMIIQPDRLSCFPLKWFLMNKWDVPNWNQKAIEWTEKAEKDFAIAMYWDNKLLATDDSYEMSTIIGLHDEKSFERKPIELTLSTPYEVNENFFELLCIIENLGIVSAKNIKFSLNYPQGVLFDNDTVATISEMKPFERKHFKWVVTPNKSSMLEISASADYEYIGTLITAVAKKQISVNFASPSFMSVKLEGNFFSPDGNGKKDFMVFKIQLNKTMLVKKWELIIKDKGNLDVFRHVGTNILPQEFVWDGKSEAGEYLPEGKYSYEFNVLDDMGELHNYPGLEPIVIDITKPWIDLTLEYFGEFGMVLTSNTKTEELADWKISIMDTETKKVVVEKYEKGNLPTEIALTFSNEVQIGHKYSYKLIATDTSGNTSEYIGSEIMKVEPVIAENMEETSNSIVEETNLSEDTEYSSDTQEKDTVMEKEQALNYSDKLKFVSKYSKKGLETTEKEINKEYNKDILKAFISSKIETTALYAVKISFRPKTYILTGDTYLPLIGIGSILIQKKDTKLSIKCGYTNSESKNLAMKRIEYIKRYFYYSWNIMPDRMDTEIEKSLGREAIIEIK